VTSSSPAGTSAVSPGVKARDLLFSKLTDVQERYVRNLRYIPVTGSMGGHYHIDVKGTVQNICSADGRIVYCAGPLTPMPDADVWLCQKLLIEADEEEFLRVADPIRYMRQSEIRYDRYI